MLRRRRMSTVLPSWVVTSVLILFILATSSLAGVPLAPSQTVSLPGTTAAAEPDLAGVVLKDDLLRFEIKSATGALLCAGRLQNRVVRSTKTGFMHFYYRFRDMRPGLPGQIVRVNTLDFHKPNRLLVDFRLDGLGVVAPRRASRNAPPGDQVAFHFRDPVLRCSSESRFFFIKTFAGAFKSGGKTVIHLVSGETTSLPTVMPGP